MPVCIILDHTLSVATVSTTSVVEDVLKNICWTCVQTDPPRVGFLLWMNTKDPGCTERSSQNFHWRTQDAKHRSSPLRGTDAKGYGTF